MHEHCNIGNVAILEGAEQNAIFEVKFQSHQFRIFAYVSNFTLLLLEITLKSSNFERSAKFV